jgi:phosphopantothenoylcysteine decarboxylase / phosphopantothenate---cysteine ligase
MTMLRNRHIVLGITGGIAAYKSCELVRRLQDQGMSVQVVMTEAATRFVSAMTFQALSGRPVYTDAWDPRVANHMPHIDLSREADGILVAPASADFMARLAQGQANDLLTTLCLAREVPLWIAPAMNRQMWQHPATQENVTRLNGHGVALWGPGEGSQACGEVGDGRMLEPAELIMRLETAFGDTAAEMMGRQTSPASSVGRLSDAQPLGSRRIPLRGLLDGRRVVITAGPTFEPIDPVRGITNRSSGKMGFALAEAAVAAGAEVTLVAGPVSLATPQGLRRLDITTAQEMANAVQSCLPLSPRDVFIGVAAVADWRPSQVLEAKIKKDQGDGLQTMTWVENPDILATVGHLPADQRPYTVGFAAETGTEDDLRALLAPKRARKAADLIVGNLAVSTFGQDRAALVLFDGDRYVPLEADTKSAQAHQIILAVVESLRKAEA